MAAVALMEESVWLQQPRFEEAEAFYQAVRSGAAAPGSFGGSGSSLVDQISQTRQAIHNVLNRNSSGGAGDALDEASMNRLETLEKENKSLKKAQDDLKKLVERLEKRVAQLEVGGGAAPAAKDTKAAPAANDDDDEIDLFGSDEEEDSAEAERIKQERVELYKKKKAGKTAIIAKSSVVIDVKPWDDETDMGMLEQEVRSITMDGLVWGASKLVEVGYGIKKLQIMMTIEDDKVSVEDLNEQITEDKSDYVQSVDIVAFNKI